MHLISVAAAYPYQHLSNQAKTMVGLILFQWQIAPTSLANSPLAYWRFVGMMVAQIICTMPTWWHTKKRKRSMH
eukprot:14494574-Ditylum_brightwellii.AAC.1